jgi:iron complex outermembrane receptor protein
MKGRLLLGSAVFSLAVPAYTQTPGAEAPQAQGAMIEEVMVTARQRTEALQDVPIAVSAMDAAFIEKAQLSHIDSLERYMPNVELGRHPFTGGGMSASIRGVSFGDLDRAFEPAVAVAVDGVFLASNTGAMADTFDIESVEVLRGPQGTLFGRNTIGGVINIKRAKPTLDWGGKLQGSFASYDRRELKGIVDVPIAKDKVGFKAGGYVERSDSFTRSATTGEREDGIDRVSAFAALRVKPNEAFDAVLTIDHIDDDSTYPSLVPLSAGPGLGADNQLFCTVFGACYGTQYQTVRDSGFELALNDYAFRAKLTSTAAALNMTQDFDAISIESITGYMEQEDALDEENTGGADFLPGVPIFVALRDQDASQFSQELRAISHFNGRFDFVAGLYYMRSEFDLNRQQAFVNGNPAQDFSAGQTLNAYAVYGEGYLEILPELSLTLGGRYTVEEKDFYITFRNPATGAVTARCPDPALAADPAFDSCRDPDVTFEKFTPRVILDYHFTPDLMIYGGWSRGYRSGGWNSRATVITAIGPYDPETVDSYEVGLRTTLLDQRLRLNVTGFYSEYDNKQEEVITASPVNPLVSQTVVENAGAATIQGIEAELEFAPSDWLRLRSAVGYLDGQYDEFVQAGVDISHLRNLRYAPEWSASAGGEAFMRAGDGEIQISANYKWTDRFATAVVTDTLGLNRDFIDAYGTFDAAIAYARNLGSRTGFRIAAFVNDAFHEDGRLYRKVITGPFSFGSREGGRTYGLEMSVTY